jgi:hypothetical protein
MSIESRWSLCRRPTDVNRQDAKDAKMKTIEQFTGLKLTAKMPSAPTGAGSGDLSGGMFKT